MSYIKIVVLMIDRWCLFGCLALWDGKVLSCAVELFVLILPGPSA